MNSFEIEHRTRANRFLMIVMALHVPAYTLFAAFGLGSVIVALFGSLLICLVPALLTISAPANLGTSISISSATMGMSMLLIYLGDGKIEYHFHVFSFLAVLCYLASPVSVIAAALTIAVHHVAGWWFVPRILFNYDASFADVAVHAVFVVIETGICCTIAQQFALTNRIRGVLEQQVMMSAEQVAAGSREIAHFIESFARSATTQASMVDQISGASQEMKESVANHLETATVTHNDVTATIDTMAVVNSRLSGINREMQAVSAMNRKISGIVNLMMDIARQTNILAVNASIEASRSGNSGGGFGVIADQVRDLAVRTSQATTEIDSLISNSVSKVDSSAAGIAAISSSFDQVHQATQQMKSLIEGVREMGQFQAGSIEQISNALNRISNETQSFASAAKETAGTSAQLSELAGDLRATLATLN